MQYEIVFEIIFIDFNSQVNFSKRNREFHRKRDYGLREGISEDF